MRNVLAIVALAEAGTGLLLLVWPRIVVHLLFGAEVGGAGVIMSRIAGIALIGLGVACWPGNSPHQPLNVMLTYSTLAMLYLGAIGIRGEAVGVLVAGSCGRCGLQRSLVPDASQTPELIILPFVDRRSL